ncbi:MAG: ABC transporter ATP-binding protein [Pseudomonadota bacterium]
MPDIVIKAENLGKKYVIGHQAERGGYTALRDVLMQNARTLWNKTKDLATGKPIIQGDTMEEVWALKDVSFEICRGEAVGIIGRNGAGKSTLLKILSRITEPSTGRVTIKGRVASLLEVGTGFHPELTGRENIFLNGTILGMTRQEIKKKFDEIVAFAEVEKYLDTPVKRYSSGMYVRLAFAVAAHLEPEILIVDEVLAVGDAAFQKKCLGKMEDVATEGRTVLFVSHNMGAINRLCARAIWLDEGYIQMLGATKDVVAAYLSTGSKERGECQWDDQQYAPGDEHIRLRSVRIRNSNGEVTSRLDIRLPFYVEIEYEVLHVLSSVRIGFRIITADGTVVFTSADSNDSAWDGRPRHPGTYVSRCEIPGNLLNEGQYGLLNVWADIPFVKVMFLEENLLNFHVEQTGGVSGRFPERWSGVICPALPWSIATIEKKG